MNRIISTLLFFFFFTALLAQKEPVFVNGDYKIEIQTSGICEMCQYTMEKDLTFEKGVKSAEFDLEHKTMSIVYNPGKTDPHSLRTRITELGYHADTLARNQNAYENLPMCCKDGSHGTPIPQVPLKGGN